MPDRRASILKKSNSGTYLKNKSQELEEFTIEAFRDEGHALLVLNPKTTVERSRDISWVNSLLSSSTELPRVNDKRSTELWEVFGMSFSHLCIFINKSIFIIYMSSQTVDLSHCPLIAGRACFRR